MQLLSVSAWIYYILLLLLSQQNTQNIRLKPFIYTYNSNMDNNWKPPKSEKKQLAIEYLTNLMTGFAILLEAYGKELEKTADRESRLSLALDIEELGLDIEAISRILNLMTKPIPKESYTPAPEFLELFEKHGIKNSEDYKKWIEGDPENKRWEEISPILKKVSDRIRAQRKKKD